MTVEKPVESMRLYRQKKEDGKFRIIQEYTPAGDEQQAAANRHYEAEDQMAIPVIVPLGPPGPGGMVEGKPENINVPIHFQIPNAGNFVDAFDSYDAAMDAHIAIQRPIIEKRLQAQGMILNKPQSVIVSGAGAPLPPPPGEQRGDIFRKGRR